MGDSDRRTAVRKVYNHPILVYIVERGGFSREKLPQYPQATQDSNLILDILWRGTALILILAIAVYFFLYLNYSHYSMKIECKFLVCVKNKQFGLKRVQIGCKVSNHLHITFLNVRACWSSVISGFTCLVRGFTAPFSEFSSCKSLVDNFKFALLPNTHQTPLILHTPSPSF